jgi:hypothetical protein
MLGIFEIGSCELFARLALNHNPRYLCLLSSSKYRHEPLSLNAWLSLSIVLTTYLSVLHRLPHLTL